MNEIKTNDYVVNEVLDTYNNNHIEEVKKIVSINRNNIKTSREFIVRNTNYTADEKLVYLEILDVLNNVNVGGKFKTTNYDGKVYSLMFITDFVKFIRKPDSKFTMNEFKLLLTIYELISTANSISNCLIGCKKKYLAEQSGIEYKNLSKVFNSLKKKNILKEDDNGSLFINYEYFFMGNSMNYDIYKIQYDNIE